MIFGDPSKFAISYDVVDAWNSGSLKNGVLNLFINFTLLGNRKNIVHALGSNLHELHGRLEAHKTQDSKRPLSLFGLSDAEIYGRLYEYTFPLIDTGSPSGWEYLAVPYSVYDEGDCLFLVKGVEVDNLYYGSSEQFKGTVQLPAHEYEKVVEQAYSFFSQN